MNMLGTLAEYERELIVERVNAGLAASRRVGTVFGRPLSDPKVIGEKLEVVWRPGNGTKARRTRPDWRAGVEQPSTGTRHSRLPAIRRRAPRVGCEGMSQVMIYSRLPTHRIADGASLTMFCFTVCATTC